MSRTIQFRYSTKKRFVIISLSIFLIYLIFLRQKRYTETFELTLTEPNSIESKLLWEFIADFSNHPKFNPTITNFEILYEKGNYENWEYGVNYEQDSSVFPSLIHYQNHAVFKILPEIKESFQHIMKKAKSNSNSLFNIHEPAKILSNFTTCSMGYCFESRSEMSFITIYTPRIMVPDHPGIDDKTSTAKLTKVLEKFHFDCSPLLSYFYSYDIHRQKEVIYENIKNSIIDVLLNS